MVRLIRYGPLVALVALSGCLSTAVDESAVQRGDESFAQGRYDEALAQYRLAVGQGEGDAPTLARVAQTYAAMGRVDDAGSYFRRAAEEDPDMADLAAAELIRLAREARSRKDRFAMATAVETALDVRPGIGVGDMSLDLARHYFGSGQYGRALPFYQKSMAEATDSAPAVVFEVGRAYEEIGDCEHALVFFERFRQRVRSGERGEVDWYIGTCSFGLARQLRAAGAGDDGGRGDLPRALQLVDRALEVGEPRNIQAQAWFEKAEILSEMGSCAAAMDAYAQVRFADPAGNLVDRAQDRFDEIRFGRGLESLRGGRCR